MLWIPTNKKTGAKYPAIQDEEKAAYLSDPFLQDKYTFVAVAGSDKAKAPEPVEAKTFAPASKPKEEKE